LFTNHIAQDSAQQADVFYQGAFVGLGGFVGHFGEVFEFFIMLALPFPTRLQIGYEAATWI
jgi:hypothetical protein